MRACRATLFWRAGELWILPSHCDKAVSAYHSLSLQGNWIVFKSCQPSPDIDKFTLGWTEVKQGFHEMCCVFTLSLLSWIELPSPFKHPELSSWHRKLLMVTLWQTWQLTCSFTVPSSSLSEASQIPMRYHPMLVTGHSVREVFASAFLLDRICQQKWVFRASKTQLWIRKQ